IEVFFDGAPPGQAGERSYGTIRAHFVAAGLTADDAILRYLLAQKGAARNVTVVSSDRQVQANARSLHAGVVSSEEFARLLSTIPTAPPKTPRRPAPSPAMSDKELGGWYDLFNVDPAQAETPIEPPRTPRPPKKGRKKRK
ncbi:MAG: NYN domain-containing protein, partial [Anaerolineaceae bacterium]|nr:NYN domain-containing protein [Anaerolineaceae bacterium]